MNDLVDFLLARIAEDEKRAGEVLGGGYALLATEPTDWRWQCGPDGPSYSQAPTPRRVLAECDAKRLILEQALVHAGTPTPEQYVMDRVLEALALPYADHPDYRQGWSP